MPPTQAELESELVVALDAVLDVFEACGEIEIDAMPIIVERLRLRGVELPAWVELMV